MISAIRHVLQNILLLFLKVLILSGFIVGRLLSKLFIWIRRPSFPAIPKSLAGRSWPTGFQFKIGAIPTIWSPKNMAPQMLGKWRIAVLVAGVLLLGFSWKLLLEVEPQEAPRYFAADLRIPPESLRFIGSDSLFRAELVDMGHRLNLNPSWILAVMYHESKLNPRAINYRGSGATGLIQFMGPALQDLNRRLGTRYYLSHVREMSALGQLVLVEAYFAMVQERYGPIGTFTDAYLAVLFPKAIGKEADHVLFSSPSLRYRQNIGLDMDRDGRVRVGDISQRLHAMFPDVPQRQAVVQH